MMAAPEDEPTPHAILLMAFAKLKKEKDALVALTALQKNDKDALVAELDSAKKSLAAEKAKTQEMEAKVALKQVSAECQIAEVESFSKETIKDAVEKNSKYSERIVDLQNLLTATKKEKEHLLSRTAALARRDQLQKASLNAMTEEIQYLTDKVKEFESQFSFLATRSVQIYKDDEREDDAALERLGIEWMVEKKEMNDKISKLELECKTLKDAETIMKETYVQTLMKHKDNWQIEKTKLEERVKALVDEKRNIEVQVAGIADLLEKEHFARYGKPFSEEAEEPTTTTMDHLGKTKTSEVCADE